MNNTDGAAGAASLRRDGPHRAAETAIVLFGAGLTQSGQPGPELESRLQQALKLAQRHLHADVVVSGGAVTHDRPEAEAMAEWLVERGVSRARIVVEPEARYTLDNAERVAPLLVDRKVQRVHLVTEAFHMPRSEALLKRALEARGANVDVRSSAAPDAVHRPGRVAQEAKKLVRDQRTQAGLHGFEPRIPFGTPPTSAREWWA